jgi:hypothetical protein
VCSGCVAGDRKKGTVFKTVSGMNRADGIQRRTIGGDSVGIYECTTPYSTSMMGSDR